MNLLDELQALGDFGRWVHDQVGDDGSIREWCVFTSHRDRAPVELELKVAISPGDPDDALTTITLRGDDSQEVGFKLLDLLAEATS